jgi:hypothetical protein
MSVRLLVARPAVPRVLCIGLAAAALTPAGSAAPPVNQRARVLKEFGDRAARYAELHREAASTLPALPKEAEPERIAAHEKALARAVRSTRPRARRGEIFIPEVVPVFVELLRSDLAGPRARDARETVEQGNPRAEKPATRRGEPATKDVALVANAPYPEGAPLSSVPPDLLARLPKLPEPLEYRFVGGHLILHDADARLVVDYLEQAVPW